MNSRTEPKSPRMMEPLSNDKWIDRLARALINVAHVQQFYADEIRHWHRETERRDRAFPSWDPSEALRSLYWGCQREDEYSERRYAPLRGALNEAKHVVGEHPALTNIRTSDSEKECGVRILTRLLPVTRLKLIAGLMGRAEQIGKHGFVGASRELKTLLDLSLQDASCREGDGLNEGCHVSVFFGLRFTKEFAISDSMTVVPFEQMDRFVNRNILGLVAPHVVNSKNWKSVGVLVNRFRWTPHVCALDEKIAGVDWNQPPFKNVSPFFQETEAFVALLAIFHGAPVVSLMNIDCCADRRAFLLLGEPYYHAGSSSRPWAASFGALRRSCQLDSHALDRASRLFSEVDRERHQQYAPVISRLAEALARSGQYASQDKILDVAIALERMYELDSPEVTFKLKARAACFLESETAERKRVFKEIGQFYAGRSAIVHRRKKKPLEEGAEEKQREQAFATGFELARQSLLKLLKEGPPPPGEWDNVILERQDGPGAVAPG